MRRAAPFLVLLGLVVVLATAGATAWSVDPAPYETANADLPAEDAPEAITAPDPRVDEGRCGRVTYTPPTASDRHRATLCRPSDTPRGLVILVHGGGGYSGDRGQMTGWAGWYRSQGFATMAIDYTLVGDGSPEPVFPRPEQDVKAAVQWGHLQAERLGYENVLLHGSSAGARLAATAMTSAGDDWFDSPDLWGGSGNVVDDSAQGLIGFYGYYDGDTLEPEAQYGGIRGEGDGEVNARWRKADAVAHAHHATGPVLLFHGDVDGLINIAQTERFGSALADAGIDVTAFIVTDGNHAFDGTYGDLTTDTGDQAADQIAAWLANRFPI
jgi:acetyl esterase/lipase